MLMQVQWGSHRARNRIAGALKTQEEMFQVGMKGLNSCSLQKTRAKCCITRHVMRKLVSIPLTKEKRMEKTRREFQGLGCGI